MLYWNDGEMETMEIILSTEFLCCSFPYRDEETSGNDNFAAITWFAGGLSSDETWDLVVPNNKVLLLLCLWHVSVNKDSAEINFSSVGGERYSRGLGEGDALLRMLKG